MNKLPRGLPGIQEMLGSIYDQHDAQYYPSIKDLILKLVWAIGVFSSAQRKGAGGKTPRYLADTFAWWVALCAFLKFDAADTLWEKYPGVCIYCGFSRDCECEGKKQGTRISSLEEYRQKHHRIPKTFAAWQAMFARIYGKQNALYGLDHALARLPEEVMELIECVLPSIEDTHALKLELADIGARIFSLAVLLEINLERVLLSNYCGVCPSCHSAKCQCQPHAR